MEPDSEGQVEDGVRVALLKLVTDGSRPIGEMSDSWEKRSKKYLLKEKYRLGVIRREHC